MTKQQFDKFLETKTKDENSRPPFNWEETKQKWLSSLESFYKQLEPWLADYIQHGKIKMEPFDVIIDENNHGRYKAEGRIMWIGSDKITLRPIGTLLIGVHGRVDLEGPRGSVKFILVNKNSNGVHIAVKIVETGAHSPRTPLKDAPPDSNIQIWKIATPPPKVRFIDLTAETFFDAITEVLNG